MMMKYDKNNKHLTDFQETKGVVIDNYIKQQFGSLKKKEEKDNHRLYEYGG